VAVKKRWERRRKADRIRDHVNQSRRPWERLGGSAISKKPEKGEPRQAREGRTKYGGTKKNRKGRRKQTKRKET